MARLLSILALLLLALAPTAQAMDHSHHAGHGSEQTAAATQDTTWPDALTCDALPTQDDAMPGHGACLGCCPARHLPGNVTPTSRVQDVISLAPLTEPTSSRFRESPPSHGARSPGGVSGDYCPVLRL